MHRHFPFLFTDEGVFNGESQKKLSKKKISTCILRQGDERLCTIKICFFFVVYLFSFILHTLSYPPFSVYSHAAITFLLRKMTVLSLSLCYTTHTLTFARRESLSTTHDVVVNVFFLHCCCSVCVCLSLSLSCSMLDSYLFPFVQERETREVQRVDKLFTPSMFFFLRLRTFFVFFFILSIFLFFSTFCNRQMKRQRIHTSVSRTYH